MTLKHNAQSWLFVNTTSITALKYNDKHFDKAIDDMYSANVNAFDRKDRWFMLSMEIIEG